MSATGTNVSALIHQTSGSDGEAPAPVPERRQIAFRANSGAGGRKIWIVDAGESGQTPVAGDLQENVGDDNPAWQPRPQ